MEGLVTISAPLAKVFAAHTDGSLFAQCWGRGNPLEIVAFDCRDGGQWHVIERSDGAAAHEFYGCFHEVTENIRIVQTFEYMGMPERGHVLLERADFVAVDANATEIRTLSTSQSSAGRDAMDASGLEAGWRESIEALGRLLEA